jgi:rod shape-determining protein MreC
MQQIFNFVIKNKTFLLFLLLFGTAIALTIQSHSYHRSKFINSANNISGGIYGTLYKVDQYFNLKEQNAILIEENSRFREEFLNNKTIKNTEQYELKLDTLNFKILSAKVYKNSYNSPRNYLTIDRGERDSIKQDFGVITSKGIVGIIENTSKKYATVLSILSKKSRINAQIKPTNHIGSLVWNTKSPYKVQLIDVSKFANIKIGDTIITGGQSSIFPKGIGIGTIESFNVEASGDTYNIEVKLFNDMTTLEHVYIIENRDAEEIKRLESKSNE